MSCSNLFIIFLNVQPDKMSSCANLQLILQTRTVISLLGQTGFITRLLVFSNYPENTLRSCLHHHSSLHLTFRDEGADLVHWESPN